MERDHLGLVPTLEYLLNNFLRNISLHYGMFPFPCCRCDLFFSHCPRSPEETETQQGREEQRKAAGEEAPTERRGVVLSLRNRVAQRLKNHELISYQIYMKITINYSEILGMLGTIIRSTRRHYYVNAISFQFPVWGDASSAGLDLSKQTTRKKEFETSVKERGREIFIFIFFQY